jgi:cold shock CspA family protein
MSNSEVQIQTPVVETVSEANRIVGQVKWFNNKAGYGFITVSDGENAGKDIFAHYSTIIAADSQYRYLVQGEYVEFDLSRSTNNTHEFQSSRISGIKGGKLMCETRQVNHRVVKREGDSSAKPRSDRPFVKNNNSGTKRHEKPVEKEDGFQVVRKKK